MLNSDHLISLTSSLIPKNNQALSLFSNMFSYTKYGNFDKISPNSKMDCLFQDIRSE